MMIFSPICTFSSPAFNSHYLWTCLLLISPLLRPLPIARLLILNSYDDNEASSAPAPAPAAAPPPTAPSQPQPVHEPVAQPEPESAPADVGMKVEDGGYGDDYQEEAYDDDDDVDFNLGNGSNSTPAAPQSQSHYQQDVSAPAYHNNRGSSAKEDG